MHVPEHVFLQGISGFLGSFYLFIAIMNGIAALLIWRSGRDRNLFYVPVANTTFAFSGIWLMLCIVTLLMSALAYSADPFAMKFISLPQKLRDTVDWLMSPTSYSLGSLALMVFLFWFRKFFSQPMVAWALFNFTLILMGMSLTDRDFASIVTKPDNVPIVAMVFLLGFFTWLATYRAVQNDERAKQGLEPLEKLDDEKVLVWPDLVYTELICMVAFTAFLLLWAVALQAPLEEPASSVKTPNPSKAPWYFLGLQEMLVYYDPWMAGVVLPSMIVAGLMAVPYIDFNKKGNGYYTIDQRKFAYVMFQFGFLVLWVTLIIMGTFLRGPNWNFFGPYETWDVHKVEALANVDLSEYWWVWALGSSRPKPPDGSTDFMKLMWSLYREWPGIALTFVYLFWLPPLLVFVSGFFQKMFVKMGFVRYMVLANLLLMMMLLPIKMLLRWTVNLKYFISLPEYMINF